MIFIVIILIKKPVNTGTSFFGISLVPSNNMNGIKNAPIPVTIMNSIMHIKY